MKQLNFFRILLAALCIVANNQQAAAQLGGQTVYSFLRLPQSARVAGVGGALIAVRDDDAAIAYANPAALNPTMHGQLSFNSQFIAPGVMASYAAYAHHTKKLTLHGGVQYLDYGKFTTTDPTGATQGSFSAREYAVTVGAARRLNKHYTFGLNERFIGSQMEAYQ